MKTIGKTNINDKNNSYFNKKVVFLLIISNIICTFAHLK